MLMKVQSIVANFVKPFGHWMFESNHDANQFALTTTSIMLCFVAYESFRMALLPYCECMSLPIFTFRFVVVLAFIFIRALDLQRGCLSGKHLASEVPTNSC
jgi:apolipoprotein N-acyltransferase